MASTAPLKRKRSGEDLIATIPKRALRPRIPSVTTTSIQVSKTRVKKPIVRRAALDLKPATTSPSTNLLLQKDKIIEQLRLELAEAENKLIKTQKRLDEFEKQTSRSPASSQ
jgi:ribosomal protein S7